MILLKKIFHFLILIIGFLIIFFIVLSFRPIPDDIKYGVSFSKFHADELGLDWKEAYRAVLDDLGVRKFRLSNHWPMIEPTKDVFDFSSVDYQLNEAQKRGAAVILGVGRRLPGWPECHIPEWARSLSWDDQKKEILSYIEKTVSHFKGYEAIKYWQVENEPFLSVFAHENCGDLDREFLKEEIALVKKLDPTRPILVTDSGNLGLWHGAWRSGDAFGTSVYMYLWNPTAGRIKSIFVPGFYRAKTNLMELLFKNKKSFLIELSLEPWLLGPIKDAPIELQMERMSPQMFDEIISFANKTGFDEQYLWGVEWWYFMMTKDHPEYWQKAQKLFED
jgi:hypothetical protein